MGKFILQQHCPSTSESDIQKDVIQRDSHSSAEGVTLGRVEGGHLEASSHAGPRPLTRHHRRQEVRPRLIVVASLVLILLVQVPLVSQARVHHVQAGALQGRLGVLQADREGRQLQQVVLKNTRY